MDQNINSSQNDFLWALLANPAHDAHQYVYNLQRLVNDFPQSGILQALLAHASEDKNLKKASAYFNSKALYKLINSPLSFTDVPDRNIIINGHVNDNFTLPVDRSDYNNHHHQPAAASSTALAQEQPAVEENQPETVQHEDNAVSDTHTGETETPAVQEEIQAESHPADDIISSLENPQAGNTDHFEGEHPVGDIEESEEHPFEDAVYEDVTHEELPAEDGSGNDSNVEEEARLAENNFDTTDEYSVDVPHPAEPFTAEDEVIAATREYHTAQDDSEHRHYSIADELVESLDPTMVAESQDTLIADAGIPDEHPHLHDEIRDHQHEDVHDYSDAGVEEYPQQEAESEDHTHSTGHETAEGTHTGEKFASEHRDEHETKEAGEIEDHTIIAVHTHDAVADPEDNIESEEYPVDEHAINPGEEEPLRKLSMNFEGNFHNPFADQTPDTGELGSQENNLPLAETHEFAESSADHHKEVEPAEQPEVIDPHDAGQAHHTADEPEGETVPNYHFAEESKPAEDNWQHEPPAELSVSQHSHERPEDQHSIEEEVYDEIVGIEHIAIDKDISGNNSGTDYYVFNDAFDKSAETEAIDHYEPKFSELPEETPVARAEQSTTEENQDMSKYHDDKMPYSFMWWLDKTRREHAGVYQPYAAPEAKPAATAETQNVPVEGKKKTDSDELQQQYYENIFHLTSVDELDKSVPPLQQAPYNFSPKKKEEVIIERFIQEEPQIRPQSSDKLDNENKAKKSSEDRDDLVTETLAAIYTDQMLYHKAIASYKKLMLKFPEKYRYFAEKVEQLEKKTN